MGLFNLFFGRMIDKRISAYQNDLITKHCNEVENIYRQMRGWRHDYHNHIQAMKAHLALRQIDELFHTQIGVGNRLDGGRRRVKKYLWSFLRTAPAGQVRL